VAVVFQLIYRSRVARKVRFADAEAIAAAAAENNAKSSISGLLLYTPTYFVQVLEGNRGAVESAFARISKDTRHEQVETLAATEIEEPQFGSWGMRAVTPSREMNAAVIGQLNGEAARELLLKSR
jgi:Sensors of blue-light using FAD